nr:hypothetical protein [Tanacetum cinerariifolium]
MYASVEHVLIALIKVEGCDEHWGSTVGTRGCIYNKGLFEIFHAILSVVGTTADLTRGSDFGHLSRLRQSKMSFHQALDLILELDEAAVECTRDILRQRDCLDLLSEIPWLAMGRLVNGSSRDGIDMVIKDLDLEPKINAMIRDIPYPSWWKELSKETSSKILLCGDGSCWKTFKPVASLIVKGKLK